MECVFNIQDNHKQEVYQLEKKYQDALNKPLSDVRVTDETVEFIKANPLKHRGSVRLFTGHIYTNEQFEALKEEALSKELP